MDSEDIDLSNVDYEDVLNLYRGWRKSEGALKEKNKELNAMKDRMKHMQDSHVKFRSQIQALESVKELTISLQTQLSVVQQENKQLSLENRRLTEQRKEIDEMLAVKAQTEAETNRILKDLQLEFNNLRGKYGDMTFSQRKLEAAMADETANRTAAEARAQAASDTADSLRREVKDLKARLETSAARMLQCDMELTHASEQLRNLSIEVANMQEINHKSKTAEAEATVMKGDIARLLRLLEHYPAARKFIRHWQDSQGMTFVGMGGYPDDEFDGLANITGKSSFGEDDAEFNEDGMASSWEEVGINPNDLAHMKRVYSGSDTYPMTNNMDEEIELWVPSTATNQGFKFWSSKLPHTPKSVIMDFIRSMNKVWLRRERRKLRRMRDVFDQTVYDLKRQISQARPYQGVIAERQIRRLKSQVFDKTRKQLTGKPKNKLIVPIDELHADCDSDEEAQFEATIPPHHRRPCQLAKGDEGSALHAASIAATLQDISAKKFLEVSLNSLETMGRQQLGASQVGNISMSQSQNASRINMSSLNAEDAKHPSENYLKGAIWIARNIIIVIEEMWEAMDEFRHKYLSEIANAVHDTDPRRSSHRLNLLAGSGINQALSVVGNGRNRTRDIVRGLVSLVAGDYGKYKAFARSLPVESALAQSPNHSGMNRSQSPAPGHGDHSHHYENSTKPFSASQLSTSQSRPISAGATVGTQAHDPNYFSTPQSHSRDFSGISH